MNPWPDLQDLGMWVGNSAICSSADYDMVGIMATARETVEQAIDTRKLPVDGSCPSTIRSAILLEGARLLARKDSAHGVVAFGDIAIRLATADVDIEKLLLPWRLDPEP